MTFPVMLTGKSSGNLRWRLVVMGGVSLGASESLSLRFFDLGHGVDEVECSENLDIADANEGASASAATRDSQAVMDSADTEGVSVRSEARLSF